VLAYMHVVDLGNYDLGTAIAARSRDLAEERQLADPSTASLALAFAGMFTGNHQAALDAAERALAAAEARGQEQHAVAALCVHGTPLGVLGEFDRAVEVVDGAVARATALGQPVLIGAARVTAAALHFMDPRGQDFAACLDRLTGYPISGGGANNDMW